MADSFSSSLFSIPDRILPAVMEMVKVLDVKTPTVDQPVQNFSGGNQQKVMLAKWVLIRPRFLFVDEPTRGVDVGVKADVHQLLRDLAARAWGLS